MKSYSVFVCDTCGKESRHKDDILTCEAQHLGLTVGEKAQYDKLVSDVRRWERRINTTNVTSTRKMLDIVVTNLMAFEAKHHLGDFAK